MKKPKDVPQLASRLAAAGATPLVADPFSLKPQEDQPTRRKAPNRTSKSVFLRIPADLYEKFDKEAVSRTKATGRGVTIQQVILDKLAGGK